MLEEWSGYPLLELKYKTNVAEIVVESSIKVRLIGTKTGYNRKNGV